MTPLILKNLLLAGLMIILWVGLTLLQASVGHPRLIGVVFILTLVGLSAGFWRINFPLVDRLQSQEARVTALAVIAAVMTACVVVLGAVVSAKVKSLTGAI